jgi:glycerophosphoryl diester phosphodiesterase
MSSLSARAAGRGAGGVVGTAAAGGGCERLGAEGAARPRRVGHKGAAHIAPGNTIESFRAALDAGVEMIEFDVLSERRSGAGRLLLAHDYGDMAARVPIALEEALAHLARPEYAGIELDVDVKIPGYGPRVAAALREAGLSERALVSCTYPRELREIRRADPELRLGWSVPRVQRDYTRDLRTVLPAYAVLRAMRAIYPRRLHGALRAGHCEAAMVHWRLVTPALVGAVAAAGGELYVWTVDDARLIARMAALGVHGIITNDPRLFDAADSLAVGLAGSPPRDLPIAGTLGASGAPSAPSGLSGAPGIAGEGMAPGELAT